MIVVLEVTSGPSAGKVLRLQPGQSVRVGRTERSDFALSEDSQLSGLHFAMILDENGCRINDLNSRNGTWLNGKRVSGAAVQNGDTIVAGQSTFTARIQLDNEVVVPKARAVPVDNATLHQRLRSLFCNDYQPLYVILDAARDIKILALLMQSKEEYQSLYDGVEGAKLAQFAPYLVRLQKDSLFLGSLLLEGWGNSWGVYLTCAGEFQEVRRHLRHFLEVTLPDGKQVYFRFYDPRVLRVFLPTCTEDEANQFFGPIEHYLAEDEKPETLLQFDNVGQGTDKKAIELSQAIVIEEQKFEDRLKPKVGRESAPGRAR